MLKYLHILFYLLAPVVACAQKKPTPQQLATGKALAKNCIDCHESPAVTLADPLNGLRKTRTANYFYSFIKNPMQFADENKTATKAFTKRGSQMPPFPDLSKADIKAILDYFESFPLDKIR